MKTEIHQASSHARDALTELAEVRERVRGVLTFAELAARDGVEVHRSGAALVALCPFHTERSGSFVIGGRAPDRAHCFGCGWDGDIFKFYAERHGLQHKAAVNELAGLAGVAPCAERVAWRNPAARVIEGPLRRLGGGEMKGKPSLPPLRCLKRAEMEQIAANRGLDVAAVELAAMEFRLIGAAHWPQFEDEQSGRWVRRGDSVPSWCLTDSTRNTAEFRRIDGKKYKRADGAEIKAWSTRGKNWPIGAASMGGRVWVLLVEGGPDLLAAYHFLRRFGMVDKVAVVAVLGASNRIRDEALPYFEGKRVRIMMDADAAREDGSTPGTEAAGRWAAQLLEAGAAVEVFSLAGLVRADGEPVKDLNDLALCAPELLDSEEIREAFCEWKEGFGG